MALQQRTDPTWRQRYLFGVALSQHLEPVCTLEEIGAELGITKQNAYTESVLALGRLGWLLRERLGVPPGTRIQRPRRRELP